MIDLKKENNAEDIAVWEWLLGLLDWLGDDGMSSEESETDMQTGLEVYHTKKMPWRRDVRREMGMIDGQRMKDKQVFSKRGAKPVVRIQNGTKGDTRRPAPAGLPKSFYQKEWLKAQSSADRRRLNISGEKIQWMMFY
jgi:hypothetical protein